jgi:hypothetical protein
MSNQPVSSIPLQNILPKNVVNNVSKNVNNVINNGTKNVINNVSKNVIENINNASNKSKNVVLNAIQNVKETFSSLLDDRFFTLILLTLILSIIFVFHLTTPTSDSVYEPILLKLNNLTIDNLQEECIRIKTSIEEVMKIHNEPSLYESQILQLEKIKEKLDKNKLSKKEMYLLYDTLKLMNEQIYLLQEKLEDSSNTIHKMSLNNSKMVIQDASKKIEIPVNKDSNIRNYFMKIKGNHLEDEKSYIQRLKSIENMYRNKIENMKTNSVIPQMSKDILVDAANLAVEKDKFEELKRSSVNMSKRAQDNIQLADREMKRIDGELFDMLYNKSRPHIEPKIIMQSE